MNPRTPRLSALLGMLALVAGAGQDVALAQNQAQPRPASAPKTLAQVRAERDALRAKAEAVTYDLDKLDAWIRLGEACERDLREGFRAAVVGDKRTVFMERSAFRGSVQRHVMQSIMAEFARTGDYGVLRRLADAGLLKEMMARLEEDALRKSEAYRQKLAADLDAQRHRSVRLWDRKSSLRLQIQRLNERETELAAADPNSGGLPRDPLGRWPAVDRDVYRLSDRKEALGLRLDEIRKAGNWSADHHFQVGTFIGVAKTFQELDLTGTLMNRYAGCYDTKNLRRAAVLANARTGMYTPGERIAELDKITAEFNTCIGKAVSDFQKARGR